VSVAALPADERERVLDRLEAERFDCAVIGGGITGAGIAREAAQRGLAVALLEADDFAAGTSSRSSKLIHGGLRYLALGDMATVRKTALERKVIHRMAPHLAEPRWMLVPARSRAGLAKMRVGLTTYEKLGAVDPADRHKTWSTEEIARGEPLLDREVYRFACLYREYLTEDARLVLANLRAAAAQGAALVSHAPVRAIVAEGGAASGVEAECAESGRRVRVRARCVINAAGPWVDPVRALEDPGAKPLLHLSKGVHVVVRRERLCLDHVVVLNAGGGRSIFAIPRGGIVFVGTTDTSYPRGQELWPEIAREDVEYLLAPLRRSFRVEPLAPEDVVAAWAGLRPLIAQPGKPPAEISRRDEVSVGPAGVVTIAGGKLTGYRPMARETLERAAGLADLALREPSAEEVPLPGGDFDGDLAALAGRLARETGVPASCAARLARMYGAEASAVVALGKEPLCADPDVLRGEIDWAVQREGALHLEDAIYRRVHSALYHPDARDAAVEPAAGRMASLLGWSDARCGREIAAVRERLAADLTFREEVEQ
jgi:glycerol-3-phosphate dehydrogenase